MKITFLSICIDRTISQKVHTNEWWPELWIQNTATNVNYLVTSPGNTPYKCFREDSYNFSDIIHHHNINEQEASTSRIFLYPRGAAHVFLPRDQHGKSCLDHYSKSCLYSLHTLSVELQTEFKILTFFFNVLHLLA